MPAAAPPSAARLSVNLRKTFRKAKRLKAPGPSGSCNEHLRVLAMEHEDLRARLVIGLYEDFAARLINGDLPSWFVVAWTSASEARGAPKDAQARLRAPPADSASHHH